MEKESVKVYIAQIPHDIEVGEVFPIERNAEIQSCKNEEKKKEKYCVWKLLEYAFENGVGEKMPNVRFSKTENGKWVCDKCYFSLSHTKEMVAVAISNQPVGVDVEKKREIKKPIYKKILDDSEVVQMQGAENQKEYLLKKWTQKESVFKYSQEQEYNLKKVKTDSSRTFIIKQNSGKYFLSVASKNTDKITLITDVKV